jgi:hypothetical protein
MIRFQYPELFLLALPLWFAFRRWGAAGGVTGGLRIAILALLLFAATGPELNVGGKGIDVIVVADRSRSLPAGADANIRELMHNLAENRAPGDRLGIVTFGANAQLEHVLSQTIVLDDYTKEILPDGSDLNAAVNTALNLVDPRRPARILVLSDGEANGASPLSAARRSREARVPIDYRIFERVRIGDVAVESVLLPESVAPREPFQFSVWVYADADVEGMVTLRRDGRTIATSTKNFTSGMNHLTFGDLLENGGLYNYNVEIDVPDDSLMENNKGAGVVRVDAGPRLLVLNTDGADGNLAAALRAGRIPVDVAVAAEHSLTQDSLDRYRAIIVENVPAEHLGRLKMERIAQFVEDLGGGLMLTGGERSFGTGGYFKSPLDDVLPVSMELREEHRKLRVAIAVALDRSGSMSMPVKGGKTKMDLANMGTAECVRLLSPSDMVAVIAVDSSPHVVQPLVRVEAKEKIASKALSIESMGGGIFVYEALVAAGKELMKAGDYSTRHIILFSDAQDSEEPGDYKRLLSEYEAAGITVSVIGLGTRSDVDAKLLEDIAKRGSGNVMFTTDAQELPRLFTQDTMNIARNTFIKREENQPNGIAGQLLPDARLMGNFGSGVFPNVDGYNLSYLKPDATLGVVSRDEYQAPWSSFWYRGLGRAAALCLEVDGRYAGQFGRWESYQDFLITQARWLLGGDEPSDVFVQVDRDGQDALVTLELDPQRPEQERVSVPSLVVVPPATERVQPIEPEFLWTGPDTLRARFRMDRTGTYRTLVKTHERKFARGPAVTLPYSPEYVPRIGLPAGAETLGEMSRLSGGRERTDVLEILDDPPRSARSMSLLPWLLICGILLLLVEIAGRRLALWRRRVKVAVKETAESAESAPRTRRLIQWKLRRPSRKQAATSDVPAGPAKEELPSSATAQQPSPVSDTVFDQAKKRARRRLK